MSRNSYGLVIAGEDGSIEKNQLYDSRKSKLTIDSKPNPPHFDVLENFSGGTKWTLPNVEVSKEETLFRLEHNFPFTPMFVCFFFPTSVPVDVTSGRNQYSINLSLMLFNRITLGEERILAKVDDTYFYIKHTAERYGFGDPGDHTFYGSDYQYRIRYMIFNQPTFIIDGGIVPQ